MSVYTIKNGTDTARNYLKERGHDNIVEQKHKYYHIKAKIESPYKWGKGWENNEDLIDRWDEIVKVKLEKLGFEIEPRHNGTPMQAHKYKLRKEIGYLYCHPMEISGCICDDMIQKLADELADASFVAEDGRVIYKMDSFDVEFEVYDWDALTENRYYYLHKDEIIKDINQYRLDVGSKTRNPYREAREYAAHKWKTPTFENAKLGFLGYSSNDVIARFVNDYISDYDINAGQEREKGPVL